MELSTSIEEWKQVLGIHLTMDLHQINVIYECRDFDYYDDWPKRWTPARSQRYLKEEPTEYDIDRRGWEMDKSAEHIISALMEMEEEGRGRSWPLFCSIFNSVFVGKESVIEFADGFEDGFHKIKMIVETNAPDEVMKRIESVDTRLVVELVE